MILFLCCSCCMIGLRETLSVWGNIYHHVLRGFPYCAVYVPHAFAKFCKDTCIKAYTCPYIYIHTRSYTPRNPSISYPPHCCKNVSPLHGDAEGLEEANPFRTVVLEQAQQTGKVSRELSLDGRLVAHEHAVPQPAPDLSNEKNDTKKKKNAPRI